MKVIIVGAGGRLGSRILAASVQAGHQATAFVRSKERLQAAIGPELMSKVVVVEGDALDKEKLSEAMRGHEAAVQTAGYLGDKPEEQLQFQQLVHSATEAANEALVGARRLWVLGGAGALDIPGRRGMMLVDVPGFPLRKYRLHKDNFAFLSQDKFSTLDWSMACPGVMLDRPQQAVQQASSAGSATVTPALSPARVTVDELPVRLPGWSALLPNAALLPVVAAIKGQLVGPSYDEVAAAMVAHLAPGGPLRQRRVGLAAGTAVP